MLCINKVVAIQKLKTVYTLFVILLMDRSHKNITSKSNTTPQSWHKKKVSKDVRSLQAVSATKHLYLGMISTIVWARRGEGLSEVVSVGRDHRRVGMSKTSTLLWYEASPPPIVTMLRPTRVAESERDMAAACRPASRDATTASSLLEEHKRPAMVVVINHVYLRTHQC
jgi:hypothetical protein